MNELYYQSFGTSGPPLLIVHGLFGSSTNWRSIAAALAESYRVFVPDMRNHGRSPWSSDMHYPLLANDLATFIQNHEIEPAILLGHSLGGKAAMVLALSRPSLVRRLIVADIAPVSYRHSHLSLIDAMQKLDLTAVRSRKDADKMLRSTIPDQRVRTFLLQNLVRVDEQDNKDYCWRINLQSLLNNMSALLDFPDLSPQRFDGSALFVHGRLSDYLQPQHFSTIWNYFPNAEFAPIENAGHWLHADQPRVFLQAIETFLER